MNPNFLDFEQPIADLDAKIQELRHASHGQAVNIEDEVRTLQGKLKTKTAEIFRNLTPWQVAQVARHPARPYTLDYVGAICEEFHELAGDRAYADDEAIVGGLGRINGRGVVVIGHQKGRDTKQKIFRNFGYARPEGYRKALRVMLLAQKFRRPIVVFIDTPAAYPGVESEERGVAEAIAFNLREMIMLEVPIVVIVCGEGGSGGALGIALGDRVLMQEYSVYSVIPPEGCAAILWRDANRKVEAAAALKITSSDLLALGLIDAVVPEPAGGAHNDYDAATALVDQALAQALAELSPLSVDELLSARYEKFRCMGREGQAFVDTAIPTGGARS
jgi:acetyl-CoA carboxylase carboxyl transferase subunit alpha